jgi:hypothetical protein
MLRIPYSTKPPLGAQLNRSHPLAQGLVGCWLFNEGGGNRFFNSASGSATSLGAVQNWATPLGINSINSAISAGSLAIGANFTLVSFVRPTESSNHCGIGLSSGSGLRWLAFESSTWRFLNRKTSGTNVYDLTVSGSYTLGQPLTMIASHSEASGGFISINGRIVAANSSTGADAAATWAISLFGASGRNLRGDAISIYLFNRALSVAEVHAIYANPYQMFSRPVTWWPYVAGGGTAYTSIADPGSFAITGADATSLRALLGQAEPGSFTITGLAATSLRTFLSQAEAGTFSVTGAAAASLRTYLSLADAGSFTITGIDSTSLRSYLSQAGFGQFLITGADANSFVTGAGAIVSVAEPGVFQLTGAAATSLRTYLDAALPGEFAITGASATSAKGYVSSASPGDYIITGAAATAVRGLLGIASPGAFVITGFSATSTISGRALVLEEGYVLEAEIKGYRLAPEIKGYVLPAEIKGYRLRN